jgi:hypothetical protein
MCAIARLLHCDVTEFTRRSPGSASVKQTETKNAAIEMRLMQLAP